MVIKVNGTPGKNGKNGTKPTAGTAGGDAVASYNGHIVSTGIAYQAIGGKGGNGGNSTVGDGAAGGNGGNASVTINGNIVMPTTSSLTLSGEADGGAGGKGGTGKVGFHSGPGGNGGNASVALNGNIIQTSTSMTNITLNATAKAGIGGLGFPKGRSGNASATINGNIVQYSGTSAVTVSLTATAEEFGSPDSPADTGSPLHGSKSATLNGNILQGNIGNVDLIAAAQFSNATATISGNIINTGSGNVGDVFVAATGQHIAVTGNIFNLGQQELDLTLHELGPTYGVTLSGNSFTGTGNNLFNFTETFNPGPAPAPDTATINLATGVFIFDGGSNVLSKFGSLSLTGDIVGRFVGTSGNNSLDASGDTTTGTIIFMGNGGGDVITGGPHALNVAQFAGSEWQYTTHTLTSVIGGPAGNTSNDTLSGIQRLKFLSPAHVSDVNNDGFGDLVFQNGSGNLQVNLLGGALPSPVLASQPGWTAVGTGQFTADTDRNAAILLQDASGDLGIEYNITSAPAFTGAILGGPAGVTPSTFTGWKAITAGDFNGDAASDVLLQQGAGGAVEIALMNTVAGQAPGTVDQISAVTSPTGANWNVISSGDFNGDGYSDILWQNSGTGALDVSLMNGAAGTPASIGTAPAGYTAIGTGDFNGDGKSDVLFENTTTGNAQIWLMNGTSPVGSPINVTGPGTIAAGWTLLGAEDINKDGFSDLLWQNSLTGDVQAQAMTTGGATLGGLQNLGTFAPNSFHLIASTGGG